MALVSTLAGSRELSYLQLAAGLDLNPKASEWEFMDLGANDNPHAGPIPDELWHDSFVLTADSLVQAWQWLPLLRSVGKAHVLCVLIRCDDEPDRGKPPFTVAQLGSGMAAEQARVIEGYQSVKVRGGKWVDVHRGAAAALLSFHPQQTTSVLSGLRVGISDGRWAAWASGDPLARIVPNPMTELDEGDIFPADVLVASAEPTFTSAARPAGIVMPTQGESDETGWSVSLPPVNTRCISPCGFLAYPTNGTLTVDLTAEGSVAFESGGASSQLDKLAPDESLSERVVSRLRDYAYIDLTLPLIRWDPCSGARLLSQFAVAGVPMVVPPQSPALRYLGRELEQAILAARPTDSPLLRESKSIDMRRSALRLFAPSSRWARWSESIGMQTFPDEAVSVVLASRRKDRVEAALAQINSQSWSNVEVVLVLHGIELTDAETDRLRAGFVGELTIRSASPDTVLGQVLNIGVEAAQGDLIAKMDDDDWYGRHHLEDLVRSRRYSGAMLVGSQVEFVYLEDLDVLTRRPYEGERYADHVAGGTMLIGTSDLRKVGGWRPVRRAVDRCLLHAVEAAGGSIYRSHGQNYVMHRYSETNAHGGHTWVPEAEIFLQNSVEQWGGLLLPPQFNPTDVSYTPPGRTGSMRSVFSQ